jgi:hypothetical protein
MQFTITSLSLLGLASAAPTLISRSLSTSTSFNLIYTPNDNAPEPVSKLNSGTWYLAASASNHAILTSSPLSGGLFYKYGNGPNIAQAAAAITITPGGTATVPDGRPIEFSSNGTAPVEIALNASGGVDEVEGCRCG